MTARDERRYAALLLRWAASLVADEAQLGVCSWPLADAGYDLAEIELIVQDAAETALAIVQRAPRQGEDVA